MSEQDRDDDFDFSRFGMGKLRDLSLGDIEKAIADALGTLARSRFTVTVQSLQFPESVVGGSARLAFMISERPERPATKG
jgi:hypothetical protein